MRVIVAALIILVALAICWLSGPGQRGPGSGKEMDLLSGSES